MLVDSIHPQLYHAFGLCLSLPFQTNLLNSAEAGTAVDIYVTLGFTPPALPQVHIAGRNETMAADIQVASNGDMLWTTAKARYWATGGQRIIIEPLAKFQPAVSRRFILYYCLPCILNQRGLLAIHANAVVGSHGAIVFMGRSGAGKSTLLATLMRRGLPMLADDLTVLQMQTATGIQVLPGYPAYRLCVDSLAQIGVVAENTIALGGERNKYMLRVPTSSLHTTAAPLHAIYALDTHVNERLQVDRVQGLQAFRLLQANCFEPASMLNSPLYFQRLNRLVQTHAIYQILRPQNRWTVDELVQLLTMPPNDHQRYADDDPQFAHSIMGA